MATVAVLAQGTLVRYGDGASPEVFTTVQDVGDIDGPNESSDEIDVTSHSSANAVREFIAGLRDAGEVSFPINLNYNNATHLQLKADKDSGVVRNWQIVIPTSPTTTLAFTAYVKEFGHTFPTDAQAQANVTLRLSSIVTVS